QGPCPPMGVGTFAFPPFRVTSLLLSVLERLHDSMTPAGLPSAYQVLFSKGPVTEEAKAQELPEAQELQPLGLASKRPEGPAAKSRGAGLEDKYPGLTGGRRKPPGKGRSL